MSPVEMKTNIDRLAIYSIDNDKHIEVTPPFIGGDRVVCVNNSNAKELLEVGEVYQVLACWDGGTGHRVRVVKEHNPTCIIDCFASRFNKDGDPYAQG